MRYGRLSGLAAINILIKDYGISKANAERIVRVAAEHGLSCAPNGDMHRTVTVKRVGAKGFTVTPGLPAIPPDKKRTNLAGSSAKPAPMRYTSGVEGHRPLAGRSRGRADNGINRKDTVMAPRKAAPEPDVEETEEDIDFSLWVEKEITPNLQDYMQWLRDETGYDLDERSAYLSVTLYKHYQVSDFRKQRRAELQAERAEARAAKAASNGAAEDDEEEAPAPRRRGRPRKTAAVAEEAEPAPKPAPPKRGRPPKAAAAAPAGKPGRPRGRKPATEEAPY